MTIITPCGRPSTDLPTFDFETFSEAGYVWVSDNDGKSKWIAPKGATKKGLPVIGAAVYAEHPSTEILMLAYDLKDGRGLRQWLPWLPAPVDLFAHISSGGLLSAWNVAFESWIWRRVAHERMGWPALPARQVRCDMGKARAYSLPPALDTAAQIMGTTRKDPQGDKLMKLFSMPQNPTKINGGKTRYTVYDKPEDFKGYASYNCTDVIAESEIAVRVPDLTPIEQEYWHYDFVINQRGCGVDVETIDAMCEIIEQAIAHYHAECVQLTNGITSSQVKELIGWCAARGVRVPDLTEATVEAALTREDLPPDVRRVLEIRGLASSASVKKAYAFQRMRTREGRIHDMYAFHGARTGRPTGGGVQPTNMPKAGPPTWKCACGKSYYFKHAACPWCGSSTRVKRVKHDGKFFEVPCTPSDKPNEWNWRVAEHAIEVIRCRSFPLLRYYFGDALYAISGSMRGMFIAGDGKAYVSSDYTAIEAVGLAMLAGEQWRIDLFRAKGKIYEKSASLVTGVPYAELIDYEIRTGQKHPFRQIGKIAELALGYQGWVNAWRQFEDGDPRPEEEVKQIILKWRAASPAIVEFWGGQSRNLGYGKYQTEFYGVEGAFIKAVLHGRAECRGLVFERFHRDNRTCLQVRLLSGRYLTYHNVELGPSERANATYAISYEGYNTNPTNGPVGWITIRTWGGKLVENIVQATTNDLLRFATKNLEESGFPVVMHTYDEIVSEVEESTADLEKFEGLMALRPEWAADWPVYVDGGYVAKRYRKG